MGRFSKKETVFYRQLHSAVDPDTNGFQASRNSVLNDQYALPYVAIRMTGFDYVLEQDMPRVFISWDELARIEVSIASFLFFLKSGATFQLKFLDLDYSSVQAMKEAFADRGLLISG